MDIRETARRELERKGWAAHRLAKAIIDQVSPTAVYNFLNGKTDPSLSVLGVLLDGLGLVLVPKSQVRRTARPSKPASAKRQTRATAPPKKSG